MSVYLSSLMISFVRNPSVRRNFPRTTDRTLDGISGLGYPQDNGIEAEQTALELAQEKEKKKNGG
ncbi:hypothetical protein MUP59_05080 [Candidatus Bathyarchaeota archaeon]|nr:hypothetical protein [Candidatus Bathyarchaeota archaeon]